MSLPPLLVVADIHERLQAIFPRERPIGPTSPDGTDQ